jgi:hypothetical protein
MPLITLPSAGAAWSLTPERRQDRPGRQTPEQSHDHKPATRRKVLRSSLDARVLGFGPDDMLATPIG